MIILSKDRGAYMNKNNRGFTLIELLAVMVILVGISLIAVSGISASLERRNEREYEEQIQVVKSAAKIYFSLEQDKKDRVMVSDLKTGNYFNQNSKVDKLIDSSEIRVDTENGGYSYCFNNTCTRISNQATIRKSENNKYQYCNDDICVDLE